MGNLMKDEGINELADDVIAVIGRDAAYFRTATVEDIGELLHNIAQATDPAAEDTDHAWRVHRTADWYRHVDAESRVLVLREINRQLAHEGSEAFVGRWKAMSP